MPYEHIQRLEPIDPARADSEVPALIQVIEDYRKYLPVEAWKAFQVRVAREWAIETGQIEGLYQFDRGLTITLIENGITESRIPANSSHMSPEQVAAILRDHITALEGLFTFIKGERQLSKSYIHELHQALLRNQTTHVVYAEVTKTLFEKELITGKYKEEPNNPTRPDGSVLDFCPWEQVDAEMDQLMHFYREHENGKVPVEIQAAWLHHAFTHIHPYPDGNGRVARALATLVLVKGGLMPLVVPTTEKHRVYIPALEQADTHDYSALVAAIRRWQRRLVVELSQRVEFGESRSVAASMNEFFAAVEHDLLRREIKLPPEWLSLGSRIEQHGHVAAARLRQVAVGLKNSTQPMEWGFAHQTDGDVTGVKSLLKTAGFDWEAGRTDVLVLQSTQAMRIEVAAGRLGPKVRGLGLAAVRIVSDGGIDELVGNPMLIIYAEGESNLERFTEWLEPLVLEGLNRWRQLNLVSESVS